MNRRSKAPDFVWIVCLLWMAVSDVSAQLHTFRWSDYDLHTPVRSVEFNRELLVDTNQVFREYFEWLMNEDGRYVFHLDKRMVYTYVATREQDDRQQLLQWNEQLVIIDYTSITGTDTFRTRINIEATDKVTETMYQSGQLISEIRYTLDKFNRYCSEAVLFRLEDEDGSFKKRIYREDSLKHLQIIDSTFDARTGTLFNLHISSIDTCNRPFKWSDYCQHIDYLCEQWYAFDTEGKPTRYYNRLENLYDMLEFQEIQYNSHGDEVKRTHFQNNVLKATLTQTYHYDEHGNWIEKHLFLDNQKIAVIKRMITYD